MRFAFMPAKCLAFLMSMSVAGVMGCGDEAPPSAESSQTKAKVSGTVTADGKKIKSGEVVFDPANINRKNVASAKAKIENGAYQLETLVGMNSISVTSPEIPRSGGSHFEVKAGDNKFDIELNFKR